MLVPRRTHRAHSREYRAARDLRRTPRDFQVLRAVVVALDPERHRFVLRLQVVLPQIGRLQDMPVGVDRALETKLLNTIVFCRHVISFLRLGAAVSKSPGFSRARSELQRTTHADGRLGAVGLFAPYLDFGPCARAFAATLQYAAAGGAGFVGPQ